MHGPSGSFRPGHQQVAHCGQCTAIVFVVFVTSQHNAHNTYLFMYVCMFEDSPLLTGSCLGQQPRPLMIQVNSLLIVMHSDDEE